MKKFLVIGKPIEHSLSPKLQNYWIKNYKLDAIYGKLEAHENDLLELCKNLKDGELDGLNVTIPYKNLIAQYIDVLSGHALRTNSVNTISVDKGILIGHNTDIDGFELSIKKSNYNIANKSVFILGAGGVVPSRIYGLKRMNVSKIILSNRTKEKAVKLRDLFDDLTVVDWGDLPEFDMIINATSLGLKENDKFPADPESAYGWSKLIGDIEYKYLSEESDLIYTNLDLHNVYGFPTDTDPATAQVIPSLIKRALENEELEIWGDGSQGRGFLEVNDVVDSILLAIKKEYNGSIMIGPEECSKISELAEIIIKNPLTKSTKISYDLSKPIGDIGRYADSSIARKILGWEPKISLESGINSLIKKISEFK